MQKLTQFPAQKLEIMLIEHSESNTASVRREKISCLF